MTFSPEQHLRNLKGQQYLDVKWRLLWLRDEHPNASIRTEMTHLDTDSKLAVFRAEVSIPEGGSATGYGSETERDFPQGWIEKAECVPLRSEILTRRGFKHFDEVEVGEEVLAYDARTDRTVWTRLRAVSVFPSGRVIRLSNRWGFRFDCTDDHSWAVQTQARSVDGRCRTLRKASDLRAGQAIVVAAPAFCGNSPLTPEEAAIIGWVFTDGTVKRQGRYVRASIMQSKPQTVAALRDLVGGIATETMGQPTTRTFPTGKTYDCLPQHTFILPAAITRALFQKAGISDDADLPALACRLTGPARRAMFAAMMQAGGDKRGTFGKKRRPGVMEAWQILATLEGKALGGYVPAKGNRVPTQRLRKGDRAYVESLTTTPVGLLPVWCPTTDYGTWVMRQDGNITITGNTKAIGRALAALGYGTQFALDLGDDGADDDKTSDLHKRAGQQQTAQQPTPHRPATISTGASSTASAFGPAQLKSEVTGLLAKDTDAAALLKKTADEMSPEELDKALTWLRHRAKR